MDPSYPALLCVFALANLCQAQYPPESEAYHAWKLTQVQYPQPPVHPQSAPDVSLRDDAPCACWLDPDSTYILAIAPNDDGSSTAIALPFTFSLYGATYDTCYVNNNGNVSFQTPYYTYSAAGFPSTEFIMLAPFWADVDTRSMDTAITNGSVTYKVTPHALYVNWTDVGYYSMHADKHARFQLILSDGTDPVIPGGNNVSFCYGDMQWTTGDASQGIDGFGGIPATVGANEGNGTGYLQLGRFDHEGTDWDGPDGAADGIGWLVDRHFSFSTASADIPPIFTSIGCDTLEIEAGTSFEYPMSVIAGGPDQVVTATSACPGIANYVETENTSGSVAHILSTITPGLDEAGAHTITYTAQNNAVPPQTNTYTLTVKVLATATGIHGNGAAAPLSVQPNPASDRATINWGDGDVPALVEVIAMDGAVVVRKMPAMGSTKLDLDLRGLADGIYTVRATGKSSTRTVRLFHNGSR